MAMMIFAVMTIPLIDTIAKWLSTVMAFTAVAFARFVFQSLFLLPAALGPWGLRSPFRAVYLVLGALIATAILFLFWGLTYLPLANNVALFFVEPLLLMLLAGWFLGERIPWRLWAAVGVGLAGALVIIRPNWALYGAASLLPLASAAAYAGYLAVTRAFTQRHAAEDAVGMQFWIGLSAAGLFGLSFLLGPLFGWEAFTLHYWPTGRQWAGLMAAGAVAALAHVLISMAFRRAPASTLASFQYLEILSASLLGWWVFNEIPDRFTILGALIIMGAGLYVFRHEQRTAEDSVTLAN